MNAMEARRRFKIAVKHAGGQSHAARLLKCSRATICRILGVERNPGLGLAVKIEEKFGIPAEAWSSARGRG